MASEKDRLAGDRPPCRNLIGQRTVTCGATDVDEDLADPRRLRYGRVESDRGV